MDFVANLHSVEVIVAVFSVIIGAAIAAISQAKVIISTLDAMARQPEISSELRFTMIIGLAMIESLAIYCLLISLIILFIKW